jgi:hypothetical protein
VQDHRFGSCTKSPVLGIHFVQTPFLHKKSILQKGKSGTLRGIMANKPTNFSKWVGSNTSWGLLVKVVLWLGSGIVALFYYIFASDSGFPWFLTIFTAGALLYFLVNAASKIIDGIKWLLWRNDSSETNQKSAEGTSIVKEPCPDKWLHEEAGRQKELIHYYVKVEKLEIKAHDLMSDSPYIIFSFTVFNYSVYKITLGELGGLIQPFGQSPTWLDNPVNNVGFGERECVFKQPIRNEEVAYLFNMGSGLDFSGLKISISVSPKSEDAPLRYLEFRLAAVDIKELKKHYPSLEIVIQKAQLLGHFKHKDDKGWDLEPLGSVINIQLHFENPNPRAIEIKGFKLNTDPPVTRITPAEKGDIYESPNFKMLTSLNNLNECPIHAEQRQPFDGWLQFILKGVQPQSLEGATPTVIIVDSWGIEHRRGTPALKRGQSVQNEGSTPNS